MRRGSGILGFVVVIWLVIGVVAAVQRDYFSSQETNCATAGTIALTIISGPLNYMGLNPKVKDCNVRIPEPSK
ncbi:hypothetical protein HH308_18520 [Gordonia sp. TBRC 11910]|uniref:Uncharacterized protein n=1 Tax=Gordonia asplenii TaxID=2725283 RepID=A0A848KY99_9ACTN|nr:hypothetical protein [Gordonia asplenii]NMO03212.1 hypothetical protein [Gordonia asplenii]